MATAWIPGDQLDPNVPSTAGIDHKAAINFARRRQKLWRARDHHGRRQPRASSRPSRKHHLRRERQGADALGEHLQLAAEAARQFHFHPPYVPHQEINASRDQVLECVLVRSNDQAVTIDLDVEPVEKPETVLSIDPVHLVRRDKVSNVTGRR